MTPPLRGCTYGGPTPARRQLASVFGCTPSRWANSCVVYTARVIGRFRFLVSSV